MAAPTKRCTFDGLTEGQSATAANTASGSGDPLSTATGSGTAVGSSAGRIRGVMGCRINGTATARWVELNPTAGETTISAQVYFRVVAAETMTANMSFTQLRNSTGAAAAAILRTDRVLLVQNAASSTLLTCNGGSALPDGDYVLWLCAVVGGDTSTGRVLAILRNASDDSVINNYDSGATTNTGTTNVETVRFGKTSSTGTTTNFDIDEVAILVASTSEIDRVTDAPAATVAGRARAGSVAGDVLGEVVVNADPVPYARAGSTPGTAAAVGATTAGTPGWARARSAPGVAAGAAGFQGPQTAVDVAFNAGYGTPATARVWTDVTDRVRNSPGISITAWRGNESETAQPNRCSLTLANDGGDFTPGKTAGAYYPNVKKGRPLRVRTTIGGVTYIRCVDYVDDWSVDWPAVVSGVADCLVTATSRMGRLGRMNVFRSIVEEEILTDAHTSYYTLGEPTDSTQANDSSGNTALPLQMVGSGTPVAFGTATGPGTDGLTAAEFAAGKYLRVVDTFYSTTVGYTLHCFVNCSATATDSLIVGFGDETAGASASLAAGYWALAVNSTGQLVLRNPAGGGTTLLTSTTTIEDGATHAVAVVDDVAAGTVKLYVDGVEEASGVSPDALVSPTRLFVGPAFTGSVAHVTTGPPVSEARLAAYSQAGLTGFVGETPAERLARYARYAGIPVAETDFETGHALIAHIDTTGKTPLDLMREVETTEGGVLFDGLGVRGYGSGGYGMGPYSSGLDGSLTFHDRAHRYGATSAFTLDYSAGHIKNQLAPVLDDQQMVNDMTVTNAAGVSARKVDQNSLDEYGTYDGSVDLATSDLDEPRHRSAWVVGRYATPEVRVSAVEVLLNDLPVALAQAVLSAVPGTRFTLSGLPANAPASSMDLFVEGVSDFITATEHRITLRTSPASVYNVWILGDSTYGVLDSTTRLAY